ncbi:MAG: hypothetical protein ACP5P3_09300 [Ignavibacteria bacterium]
MNSESEVQFFSQSKNRRRWAIFLWIIAFLITIIAAYWQRLTAPTYPLKGKILLSNEEISYNLPRSASTSSSCHISIYVRKEGIKGRISYKRENTTEPFTEVDMISRNDSLIFDLPPLPAAGKYKYYIDLIDNNIKRTIPKDDLRSPAEAVVIRFKDDVPTSLLIVHVIVMFTAMLLSNRTGLEVLRKSMNYKKFAYWTLGLLMLGGFILGPLVQKYAFGEFWTGFPLGYDLTDNKTLIAIVVWAIAIIMARKPDKAKLWIIVATLITLIVFLIPHSLLSGNVPK